MHFKSLHFHSFIHSFIQADSRVLEANARTVETAKDIVPGVSSQLVPKTTGTLRSAGTFLHKVQKYASHLLRRVSHHSLA